MRSFAQNFEDVMLWRALKNVENGFFIDIGAQHPIKDSVSKIFSESGWTGIHVEPVPIYADLLRKDRQSDMVVEAIVSDSNDLCDFYNIEGTGLSTSNKEIAESHKSNNFEYSPIIVSAVIFDNILNLCPNREIHWLKIDVEGMERAVLRGWTDASRRPWVVVIESTIPGTQISNFSEWEDIILDKGYNHVYSDGLNRFYLHNNHKELSKHFDFPPNVFDGFQLTQDSGHVIEIVRAHDQRVAKLESYISAHEQALQSRTDEIVAGVRSEMSKQLDAALEREVALSEAAASQQQELKQQCVRLQQQIELIRQDAVTSEREHLRRKDEALSNVRTEAREHLAVVLKREHALSEAAIARQQELEQQCARLQQQIEVIHGEFLAQERDLQSRTTEIISHIRAETRDQLKVALERERALFEKAAVRQEEWEQRCAELQERIEATHKDFWVREQALHSRTNKISSDIRAEGHERERALAEAMANQQAEHGLAVATLAKSYEDRLGKIQNQLEEEKEKSEKLNREFRNIECEINDKKRLIKQLSLITVSQKDILYSVIGSGSWKFSAIYRFFFRERNFYQEIINIEGDARASHIAASIKNGNTTPASVCDSDGLEGATQLAVCPISEKSQDHDGSKHQGCNLDMSSQDISNVIDLISLPLDQFIATSYNLFLGRNPEPSELRLHSSTLRAGLGRGKMLFEIYSSPEYLNRYNQMIGSKNDDEFISWLYHRYIHRSPDQTGLTHYLSMLRRGTSREQVKKDIGTSSEAQSAGGLWIELDRLLESERQQQKRSRRWIRRSRLTSRLQHQEQEALLQLGHISEERLRMRIAQVERRQLDQAAAIYRQLEEAGTNVPLEQISDLVSHVTEPISPLATVDTSDMSPEARRIILRLQHVKGASPLEKGRI
ncbi:FkbM family methyltransferase [Sphingobium sp.]|uniref:FkbM family methyltransferase n=1 Tax=Sphingobium sp. TaxID=1912891 RepID=UPI0025EE7355|nr:FkbM family methyltransferase [Sphingobium sp.]